MHLLLGLFVFGIAAIGVVAVFGDGASTFVDHRLAAPTGYPNASAALFLGALPLAVALAARRDVPGVLRVLALVAAGLLAQLAVLAQSRGSVPAVALAVAVLPDHDPDRRRCLLSARSSHGDDARMPQVPDGGLCRRRRSGSLPGDHSGANGDGCVGCDARSGRYRLVQIRRSSSQGTDAQERFASACSDRNRQRPGRRRGSRCDCPIRHRPRCVGDDLGVRFLQIHRRRRERQISPVADSRARARRPSRSQASVPTTSPSTLHTKTEPSGLSSIRTAPSCERSRRPGSWVACSPRLCGRRAGGARPCAGAGSVSRRAHRRSHGCLRLLAHAQRGDWLWEIPAVAARRSRGSGWLSPLAHMPQSAGSKTHVQADSRLSSLLWRWCRAPCRRWRHSKLNARPRKASKSRNVLPPDSTGRAT